MAWKNISDKYMWVSFLFRNIVHTKHIRVHCLVFFLFMRRRQSIEKKNNFNKSNTMLSHGKITNVNIIQLWIWTISDRLLHTVFGLVSKWLLETLFDWLLQTYSDWSLQTVSNWLFCWQTFVTVVDHLLSTNRTTAWQNKSLKVGATCGKIDVIMLNHWNSKFI